MLETRCDCVSTQLANRLQPHKHSLHHLLYRRLDHRHMFSHWIVNADTLAGRVFYQSPATWFSDTTLQEQWRTLDFLSQTLRRNLPQQDIAAFAAKGVELRQAAAATLNDDKRYYINNKSLRAGGVLKGGLRRCFKA